MKARGEWRATYASIDDDRDWRKLSPVSKCVFDTLKRQLGQYGINLIALETLPRIINCSAAQLELAFQELEAAKPGKERGWIRREEDVIWLVNGLRFEPSITLSNKNHRSAAAQHGRHLYQLTGLEVVKEFMEYYDLGRPTEPNGRKPRESHTDRDGVSHAHGMGDGVGDAMGMGTPIPRGMPGGITEKETDTERETESKASRAHASTELRVIDGGDDRPASPARYRDRNDLPLALIEFLQAFYPTSTTPPDRLRVIEVQLLRLANGDAVKRAKGIYVRAGSIERLIAKCTDVVDSGVKKADSAIVILLQKIGDTSDVTPPGIVEHQDALLEAKRDDRTRAERLAAAEAWLAGDVDAQAELTRRVDAAVKPEGNSQLQATMRSTWRAIALLELWQRESLRRASATDPMERAGSGGTS